MADTTTKKSTEKTAPQTRKVAAVKHEGKTETKKAVFTQAYRVIVRPLITEKAAKMNASGKYVFAVALDANKISVAKAIATLYGVKPLRVNMVRQEGKVVQRGRTTGKRKDWKKAIVSLPKGSTITVYEGV